MRIPDATTIRLEELLMEHPELHNLSVNDATVYAWLKTACTHENREMVGSVESVLIGIIVALGRDKKIMHDNELKRMMQKDTRTA